MRWLLQSFIMIVFAVTPAMAQSDIKYPIVFAFGDTTLQKLGISGVTEYGDERDMRLTPHRCYSYGGDGNGKAISDAMLARHKARGFSLESTCLGLVSQARFDPETGRRLPTYIAANEEDLRTALKGRALNSVPKNELKEWLTDSGFFSEEQPFSVPSCFKDGAPYSDCNWHFDIMSGKSLTPETTRRFLEFGRALEAGMARALRGEKKACKSDDEQWPCGKPRATYEEGFMAPDAKFIGQTLAKHVDAALLPKKLTQGTVATFLDISTAFPRGFGYALNAEENGGPAAASEATLRYYYGEPTRASRIDFGQLQGLFQR